jgi:hypothetical protein
LTFTFSNRQRGGPNVIEILIYENAKLWN